MKTSLIIVALLLIAAGAFFAFRGIVNKETPTPTATPSVSLSPSPSESPQGPNITVTSPKSGDMVGNPITVTGTARVFENTFNYALKDSKNKTLYENFAMTDAKDAGIFGNYTVKIPVPVNAPKDLVVEVFEYSAKDGSVINLVQVPVKLSSQQTMTVKAYFSKGLNPTDCSKVVALNRTVITTREPAFISLTELLKGLTTSEKQAGYNTNIPDNVRINSLTVRSGTAYVDFDEA